MKNNVLWLVIVPAAATGFGLLAAQLTDRLRWGNIAKSIIFMPMAISFVGAAVIFKLIYEARPEDVAQIGVLNHLYLTFGGAEPQPVPNLLPHQDPANHGHDCCGLDDDHDCHAQGL